MCAENVDYLSALVSIGAAATSLEQNRKNTRAQFRHAEIQQEHDAKLAARERQSAFTALANEELQQRESDSQALARVSRQAREAFGAGLASAGESNTTGLSLNNLLGDFMSQESRSIAAVRRNQDFRVSNNIAQAESITVGHSARLASMIPGPIPEIDTVGAYARAAIDGYATGLQIQNASGRT